MTFHMCLTVHKHNYFTQWAFGYFIPDFVISLHVFSKIQIGVDLVFTQVAREGYNFGYVVTTCVF